MDVINNTGRTRQQRRALDREREKGPRLSNRLQFELDQMMTGQGLFIQHGRYARGWPTERRQPRADYSERYKALFKVL